MHEDQNIGGSTMVEIVQPTAIATTKVEPGSYEENWKLAQRFANSFMVPAHFQGKPDAVFTVLVMARDLGLNPIQALNNIYMVSGKPGFSSALVVALANKAKIFKGGIDYKAEGIGPTLKVTASAVLASDGKTQSETVGMDMAVAEGWVKNPKYKSMPEHMLKFRAATFLIRRHHPEIMFGMPAVEELEDIKGDSKVTETQTVDANDLLDG